MKSNTQKDNFNHQQDCKLTNPQLINLALGNKINNHIGKKIYKKFGSITNFIQASKIEITALDPTLHTKLKRLKASMFLSYRSLGEQISQKNIIHCKEKLNTFLLSKFKYCQQEVFSCIFLNQRLEIIKYHELFFGSIRYCHIYPREIVKHALKLDASALILVHNHPCAINSASLNDIKITQQLRQTFAQLDILILDHLVVSYNYVFSIMHEIVNTKTLYELKS